MIIKNDFCDIMHKMGTGYIPQNNIKKIHYLNYPGI